MSWNFKNDTWPVRKDEQIDNRLSNERQYNHKHQFQFFYTVFVFPIIFYFTLSFVVVVVLLEKLIGFSSLIISFTGALTKSQFPVFTIYAQKSCLGLRPCSRAWCIDRVQGYKLSGFIKRSAAATSRRDCLEMCLGENEFTCR